MKNLDVFTKRILSIALAISMVLCSASLFVFSIQSATASPDSKEVVESIEAKSSYNNVEVPFATIHEGKLYFIGVHREGRIFTNSKPLGKIKEYSY